MRSNTKGSDLTSMQIRLTHECTSMEPKFSIESIIESALILSRNRNSEEVTSNATQVRRVTRRLNFCVSSTQFHITYSKNSLTYIVILIAISLRTPSRLSFYILFMFKFINSKTIIFQISLQRFILIRKRVMKNESDEDC